MLEILPVKAYLKLFDSDEEFAVVDTRPIDDFYRGHLMAASSLPLSRLEVDAPVFIPNRNTRIVLCDWNSALASAKTLESLGYKNISVIEGGLSGWHLAGGRIFPGWNMIGKAFGDYLERTFQIPTIDSDKLKALIESDNPPFILDTRTPEEHSDYCIPGAVSCPNGESLLRALPAIKDPERLIVTHCAGRTRGLIGAQVLRDAGVKNPICSLGLGTLEWALAGYPLEEGANRPLPVPEDLTLSRKAANALREKHVIPEATDAMVARWLNEQDKKACCVLDIRSPEEVEKGTFKGAIHVPGGQLLQGVDRFIVTRGGRIVLLDTDGIRAVRIAAWLMQMGYKTVYTLKADPSTLTSVSQSPEVDMDRLVAIKKKDRSGEITFVDIRSGVAYRHTHVDGAIFLGRENIDDDAALLPQGTLLVLLTDEPQFAERVAKDLRRLGRTVEIRPEPMKSWAAAGVPLSSGVGKLVSAPSDAIYDLEEREIHVRDSHDYILWRANLYEILGGDPAAPYLKE